MVYLSHSEAAQRPQHAKVAPGMRSSMQLAIVPCSVLSYVELHVYGLHVTGV